MLSKLHQTHAVSMDHDVFSSIIAICVCNIAPAVNAQNAWTLDSQSDWIDGTASQSHLIDQWTDWATVKESYDYNLSFAKQVAKSPARLDPSALPAGFGFQFKIKDTTENPSQPILDKIEIDY